MEIGRRSQNLRGGARRVDADRILILGHAGVTAGRGRLRVVRRLLRRRAAGGGGAGRGDGVGSRVDLGLHRSCARRGGGSGREGAAASQG